MLTYSVVPGVGIGPVHLGMSQAEARSVMPGQPVSFNKSGISQHNTDAYHSNGFQIFYEGAEPRVDYIELSRNCDFIALYRGIDVFNTKALDLVEIISKDAAFDRNAPEKGYSFIFPEIELSLWRPIIPEMDIEDEDEDEILEENSDAEFFFTIGIGIKGYYSNQEI